MVYEQKQRSAYVPLVFPIQSQRGSLGHKLLCQYQLVPFMPIWFLLGMSICIVIQVNGVDDSGEVSDAEFILTGTVEDGGFQYAPCPCSL